MLVGFRTWRFCSFGERAVFARANEPWTGPDAASVGSGSPSADGKRDCILSHTKVLVLDPCLFGFLNRARGSNLRSEGDLGALPESTAKEVL